MAEPRTIDLNAWDAQAEGIRRWAVASAKRARPGKCAAKLTTVGVAQFRELAERQIELIGIVRAMAADLNAIQAEADRAEIEAVAEPGELPIPTEFPPEPAPVRRRPLHRSPPRPLRHVRRR